MGAVASSTLDTISVGDPGMNWMFDGMCAAEDVIGVSGGRGEIGGVGLIDGVEDLRHIITRISHEQVVGG